MNKLILITIITIIIGCGKSETPKATPFACDTYKSDILSTLSVGDIVDGTLQTITDEEQQVLFSVTPVIYTSTTMYNENYNLSQYNSDNGEWCYYYSIDVDKDNKITSIFK